VSQGHPHRGDQHAESDQRLRPDAGHQDDVGDLGKEHDHGDRRQERDARDDGRVAENRLQVVGEKQEDAEHGGPDNQHRQVSAAAVPI
jgi:hypothetical protein